MKHTLYIGQVLYSKGHDSKIEEHKIGTLGNKYFYLDGDVQKRKYSMETLKYVHSDYSQRNHQLYLTKEDILLEREVDCLVKFIRNKTSSWNWAESLPVEKLRAIKELLS